MSVVYYNEFDPSAAAWLRELIKHGHLPAGDIDERSITEVRGPDLAGYAQCHFFAGIGGWPLALALAGWPADEPVWTGSCPCQPFSGAGLRRGTSDPRHLWPEFARLIGECRPATVFGEQVASKAGREWLSGVFADLEGMAYAVAGADLCAAGVSAPHIRQRLFWVADRQGPRSPHRGTRAVLPEPCGGGDVGGLQHPTGDGREQRWAEPIGRGSACGCGDGVGRLADAYSERRRERESGHEDADDATGASQAGRLEHSERAGLEGHAGDGRDRDEPGRLNPEPGRPIAPTSSASGWSDFDILPFRDGKARRVESGLEPLAHGIPARVGRLRGYGNAIVPALAAEFILSYRETLTNPPG
jgi:DNA (cytosine-5)-methyltransferase 1